jgi:hypothetical protein
MATGRIVCIRVPIPLFPTSLRSSDKHHTASESKQLAEKKRLQRRRSYRLIFAAYASCMSVKGSRLLNKMQGGSKAHTFHSVFVISGCLKAQDREFSDFAVAATL